jgi:hypothetical protein
MARTATLTVTLSSNPATAHIGPYFADLRVNGRQRTKVGKVAEINDFIRKARIAADGYGVTLNVVDDTYKNDFTVNGGKL